MVLLVLCLTGCWSQYRGGPAHTGFQPFEFSIGVSNVSALTTAWTSSQARGTGVVVGGVLYASGTTGLSAFDAAGKTNCSGVPRTCAPLWTAPYPGLTVGGPAVAGGVVFVGGGSSTGSMLWAFDAAGVTGCGGVPKTCAPLWVAAVNGDAGASAAVVSGVVYIGAGNGKLYAYDAAGVTGCSGIPRTCAPLWTAQTGDQILASPTVVDGVVYVGSWDRSLYAFDASGTLGCGGTPKACAPLWTAPMSFLISSEATVSNGVVYLAGPGASGGGALYAFDAHGVTGCSGTPKTCTPLWTAPTASAAQSAAIAAQTVLVSTGDGTLYAFDANGVSGCSGAPRTCMPLWRSGSSFGGSAPAVANGVVYVADALRLRAYDATGTVGCSGSPTICAPLWESPPIGGIGLADPTVVNGTVFVYSWTGQLFAFRLGTA